MQSFVKLYKNGMPTQRVVYVFTKSCPEGRQIGFIDINSATFFTKRKKKHVHQMTNSLAFNAYLLDKYPIELIDVKLARKNLFITAKYLKKVGGKMQYDDWDEQYFVPLSCFSSTKGKAYLKE